MGPDEEGVVRAVVDAVVFADECIGWVGRAAAVADGALPSIEVKLT